MHLRPFVFSKEMCQGAFKIQDLLQITSKDNYVSLCFVQDLKEAEQQMDGSKPAAENADGEANPAPMQIDDDGPNGRSTVASQEHRSVVPPT